MSHALVEAVPSKEKAIAAVSVVQNLRVQSAICYCRRRNDGAVSVNQEELVHNDLLSKKLANHLFADKVELLFYQNKLNIIKLITNYELDGALRLTPDTLYIFGFLCLVIQLKV
ncbi:MAG: hypothetical protein KME38_27440 [Spirirestis rafaelensis WJT71-NPBG6]|nr:hypothetical protein [Spirirestis rafaelensis WJT71-NPBG6]